MSDTCFKFCLSLSLLTRSLYTEITFKRRFQYWACASPSMKNIKWSQNGHISSEQIRFQAMQCFSSTCYPLEILMLRDMRDRNLPRAPGICPELEPGPFLCPGHGLPGWWASKLEITGSEFNSRAVHPKWLHFQWPPSAASIIFCAALNILPAVDNKIHFLTGPTEDLNSGMPQ